MRITEFKGIFALTIILSLLVYLLYQTTKGSFLYPNFGVNIPNEYPYFGIDISHHQGEVDFDECTKMVQGKDSLSFIYIKATEGTDFLDPQLIYNAEQSSKKNMLTGFYHFYRPELSVEMQALYFCNTVSELPYSRRIAIQFKTCYRC